MPNQRTQNQKIIFIVGISIAVVILVIYILLGRENNIAKEYYEKGKEVNLKVSDKKVEKKMRPNGKRRIRSYIIQGYINTSDNSDFGKKDPSCKKDVLNGKLCLPDFSSGFNINLEKVRINPDPKL